MIPRLSSGGASFKGAALYYLHDKREEGEETRVTDARVAWTYALNLPTQDPERAWRMMAHTAISQAELKAAAGVKATGRKLTKPVMAYSLSWSPDEEPPAPHEMLEAAQESLAALGLELHQALVICHNDTPHPHVHVLVNRVNPEDGIAHNGSKTKLKLSLWAEAYERSRGRILCADRVQNNAMRREGQKPDRARRITRPQWETGQVDPATAAQFAASHRDLFSALAESERAGHDSRWHELTDFDRSRRLARKAIRDRYQARIDAARDPVISAHHVRLADALLSLDPRLGLAELTRERSTFTRQDLATHIGRYTATVQEFEAVLDRLETSPELVALGRDEQGKQRFTTRGHQALEQRMMAHAHWLNAAPKRNVRPLWPQKMALTKDQDEALRHVLSAGGLAQVVGYAGTGKSTLLAAARRSWEAAGLTVHGMTLSGIAADGLRNGSGIDSRTIHSRLHQWEKGISMPGPKDVIVVDEAGMIGSRQMERILHFAVEGRSKLVLVGDPEQLQAIEAGGAFRILVARFGAAEMFNVRRQRVDWQQEATRELATNRTAEALDRYNAAGMVHGHKTQDDARAAVVDGWRQARAGQPKASQIILAYLRSDVVDLNDRARAVMREEGHLGPDVKLTTADGRRTFATGDRIYFTKNDQGLGVRNGSLATITRIERETVFVRLDGEDGRQIMFGMKSYNHITHGYAATIHKSQGVTVDRAHLLAGTNLNRHSAYVAMTRHRDRLDIHWAEGSIGTYSRLKQRLKRAGLKDSTLDYEPEVAPPLPPAAPPLAPRADRLKAIRLHMRERLGGKRRSGDQATLPQRIGQKAIADLKRAAANQDIRKRQNEKPSSEDAKLRDVAASRPSDRVGIWLTSEIMEHDRETNRLFAVMMERFEKEVALERQRRHDQTIDAAINWSDARAIGREAALDTAMAIDPDDPDLAELLRQMPAMRGPKPTL